MFLNGTKFLKQKMLKMKIDLKYYLQYNIVQNSELTKGSSKPKFREGVAEVYL